MPRTHTPHRPIKILHVEDDPDDAALVGAALGALSGHDPQLLRVANLAAGLAELAHGTPDLVLLDLELPDATGLEALHRLRALTSGTPVVVLSGSSDPDLERRAFEAGAQDVLPKASSPPASIARAVRYAAERRRLLDDLDRRRAELEASERRFHRLIAATTDGMLIFGRDGTVLFLNEAASSLLDAHRADLIGTRFAHAAPSGETREIRLQPSSAPEERILEMRVVDTEWSGENVHLACLHDITARKRDEETLRAFNRRLQELANVDPLTGVRNRRALDAELYRVSQQARRGGGKAAAVLIDCDDFKSINDRLGHAVGDIVLAQFARKLSGSIRPSDVVARIGGDEFLLLLPETRLAEAVQIAERARLAVTESPVVIAGSPLRITASIGVAAVRADVASTEEVLAATHEALATSKRRGKNRVTLASAADRGDDDAPSSAAHLADDGNLRCVHQPIFDLCLEERVGHEFLARGPAGPFEMPSDFFRLAYENHRLTALDLSCLRTMLRGAALAGLDGRVHVNLFPSTLIDTPAERLVDLFDETHPTGGLCVEISEQQLIGDPSRLSGTMARFRASGIRIAIDDVGFGRSSLESLVVLEPDIVKIDRNYVAGVADDAMKARWLRRLLRVVEHLGAECVAEGIECRRDLQRLRELGVPYGQGFLLGEPTPVDTAGAWPRA